MNRALKQILYGLLFVGILTIVGWIAWQPEEEAIVASCTDGIQNQEEEGVDCGGPCTSCELRDLRLQIGGVEIIKVGDKSSLLVRVTNPSKNFGLNNVAYQFQVLGGLGTLLESVDGVLNMGAAEDKHIAVVGLDLDKRDIEEVIFTLDTFEFTDREDLIDYGLRTSGAQTTFPEEVVRVDGLIKNESSSLIPEVVVTAIFYTESGEIANVGDTFLTNLKAFEERNFVISVPRNDFFIDPELTEISWRVI